MLDTCFTENCQCAVPFLSCERRASLGQQVPLRPRSMSRMAASSSPRRPAVTASGCAALFSAFLRFDTEPAVSRLRFGAMLETLIATLIKSIRRTLRLRPHLPAHKGGGGAGPIIGLVKQSNNFCLPRPAAHADAIASSTYVSVHSQHAC